MIDKIGERGSKVKNHHEGIKIILRNISNVSAVGHRVVHGADKFRKPSLVNNRVISKIKECSKLGE